MILLNKYIAKSTLSAIGLITLMLAGLQIFILFVNQLDDLGKGNYGIIQAAAYVFMQMPYQVYLFFPMASLLGSLVGLGLMANHSELIVMRAAGMSVGQISLAVMKAALVLVLIITLVGEFLIPKLAWIANNYKMQAVSKGQALRTPMGIWLKSGNDFIHVDAALPDYTLKTIYQFHFDNNHHMKVSRLIQEAKWQDGKWQAYGVSETIINDDNTEVRTVDQMPWDVELKPSVFNVRGTESEEMTLPELHRHLKVLTTNKQNARVYALDYWQRMLQPLTTIVMIFLAIPFIFGPLRSSTMGSKLIAGATVGFGFHIVNKFFGPISQVYQWPPILAALAPTILFAMLGIYWMRRTR